MEKCILDVNNKNDKIRKLENIILDQNDKIKIYESHKNILRYNLKMEFSDIETKYINKIKKLENELKMQESKYKNIKNNFDDLNHN